MLLQSLVGLVLRYMRLHWGRGNYTHVWQCQVEEISRGLASTFAVWLLVGITMERTLAVCLPHRIRSIATTKSVNLYISIVFVTALILQIRHFFIAEFNGSECINNHNRVTPFANFLIEFVSTSAMPFLILFVCNIIVSTKLVKMRRQRQNYLSTPQVSSADLQAAIRSLVFSTVFLILTFPRFLLALYNVSALEYRMSAKEAYSHRYVYVILASISIVDLHLNSAANFWLYLITGRKFRKHLVQFLCRCFRRSSGST